MPAYNCENYIREAIDSVLNQTCQNIELLIADDGSTDTTKKIIDAYTDPRIKRIHNSKNLGYLKTSNLLVAQCVGEYISFQDADDSSAPNRFEMLLKEFDNNTALACVGSFANRIDENGKLIEVIQLKCTHKEIKMDLPFVFNCIGSALMVKKEVIKDLGFYHNYFDRCGSEDLYWFGMVAHNYPSINIPEALYNYRFNPNSISGKANKKPKQLVSKEIAIHALIYYYAKGKSLFDNKTRLKVLENYMIGKGLLWTGDYKSGLKKIFASVFLNPFVYNGRYRLLRMYLPKLILNRG